MDIIHFGTYLTYHPIKHQAQTLSSDAPESHLQIDLTSVTYREDFEEEKHTCVGFAELASGLMRRLNYTLPKIVFPISTAAAEDLI